MLRGTLKRFSKTQSKGPNKANSIRLDEPKSNGSNGSASSKSAKPKPSPYANYKRIAKETAFRCAIFNTFWFTTHVLFFSWYRTKLDSVTVFVVPDERLKSIESGHFIVRDRETETVQQTVQIDQKLTAEID